MVDSLSRHSNDLLYSLINSSLSVTTISSLIVYLTLKSNYETALAEHMSAFLSDSAISILSQVEDEHRHLIERFFQLEFAGVAAIQDEIKRRGIYLRDLQKKQVGSDGKRRGTGGTSPMSSSRSTSLSSRDSFVPRPVLTSTASIHNTYLPLLYPAEISPKNHQQQQPQPAASTMGPHGSTTTGGGGIGASRYSQIKQNRHRKQHSSLQHPLSRPVQQNNPLTSSTPLPYVLPRSATQAHAGGDIDTDRHPSDSHTMSNNGNTNQNQLRYHPHPHYHTPHGAEAIFPSPLSSPPSKHTSNPSYGLYDRLGDAQSDQEVFSRPQVTVHTTHSSTLAPLQDGEDVDLQILRTHSHAITDGRGVGVSHDLGHPDEQAYVHSKSNIPPVAHTSKAAGLAAAADVRRGHSDLPEMLLQMHRSGTKYATMGNPLSSSLVGTSHHGDVSQAKNGIDAGGDVNHHQRQTDNMDAADGEALYTINETLPVDDTNYKASELAYQGYLQRQEERYRQMMDKSHLHRIHSSSSSDGVNGDPVPIAPLLLLSSSSSHSSRPSSSESSGSDIETIKVVIPAHRKWRNPSSLSNTNTPPGTTTSPPEHADTNVTAAQPPRPVRTIRPVLFEPHSPSLSNHSSNEGQTFPYTSSHHIVQSKSNLSTLHHSYHRLHNHHHHGDLSSQHINGVLTPRTHTYRHTAQQNDVGRDIIQKYRELVAGQSNLASQPPPPHVGDGDADDDDDDDELNDDDLFPLAPLERSQYSFDRLSSEVQPQSAPSPQHPVQHSHPSSTLRTYSPKIHASAPRSKDQQPAGEEQQHASAMDLPPTAIILPLEITYEDDLDIGLDLDIDLEETESDNSGGPRGTQTTTGSHKLGTPHREDHVDSHGSQSSLEQSSLATSSYPSIAYSHRSGVLSVGVGAATPVESMHGPHPLSASNHAVQQQQQKHKQHRPSRPASAHHGTSSQQPDESVVVDADIDFTPNSSINHAHHRMLHSAVKAQVIDRHDIEFISIPTVHTINTPAISPVSSRSHHAYNNSFSSRYRRDRLHGTTPGTPSIEEEEEKQLKDQHDYIQFCRKQQQQMPITLDILYEFDGDTDSSIEASGDGAVVHSRATPVAKTATFMTIDEEVASVQIVPERRTHVSSTRKQQQHQQQQQQHVHLPPLPFPTKPLPKEPEPQTPKHLFIDVNDPLSPSTSSCEGTLPPSVGSDTGLQTRGVSLPPNRTMGSARQQHQYLPSRNESGGDDPVAMAVLVPEHLDTGSSSNTQSNSIVHQYNVHTPTQVFKICKFTSPPPEASVGGSSGGGISIVADSGNRIDPFTHHHNLLATTANETIGITTASLFSDDDIDDDDDDDDHAHINKDIEYDHVDDTHSLTNRVISSSFTANGTLSVSGTRTLDPSQSYPFPGDASSVSQQHPHQYDEQHIPQPLVLPLKITKLDFVIGPSPDADTLSPDTGGGDDHEDRGSDEYHSRIIPRYYYQQQPQVFTADICEYEEVSVRTVSLSTARSAAMSTFALPPAGVPISSEPGKGQTLLASSHDEMTPTPFKGLAIGGHSGAGDGDIDDDTRHTAQLQHYHTLSKGASAEHSPAVPPAMEPVGSGGVQHPHPHDDSQPFPRSVFNVQATPSADPVPQHSVEPHQQSSVKEQSQPPRVNPSYRNSTSFTFGLAHKPRAANGGAPLRQIPARQQQPLASAHDSRVVSTTATTTTTNQLDLTQHSPSRPPPVNPSTPPKPRSPALTQSLLGNGPQTRAPTPPVPERRAPLAPPPQRPAPQRPAPVPPPKPPAKDAPTLPTGSQSDQNKTWHPPSTAAPMRIPEAPRKPPPPVPPTPPIATRTTTPATATTTPQVPLMSVRSMSSMQSEYSFTPIPLDTPRLRDLP